jgi:ADP-ribosylglycohydrolase
MSLSNYQGALLGLALSDALGAPHEGGILERTLWRLIGRTPDGRMRWTDDTQMSLDLGESLVAHRGFHADDVARRFALGYRWDRGFGPGAARLLKRIRRGEDWRTANRAVFPDGSYGNGGAMRAPVAALCAARLNLDTVALARDSAAITHAHPLGMEGAVLIASATAAALETDDSQVIMEAALAHCRLEPFTRRLERARAWIASRAAPPAREVAAELGNGVHAEESCVTALYAAVRHVDRPFEELHAFVVGIGGDVDTIGAMSGAVWGAANGVDALPTRSLALVEQYERIDVLARAIHALKLD